MSDPPPRTERPTRALVLSGGGARGAYEAGVLRFILGELPRRLGHPLRLEIVSGTSVGAIHACFLAATAHQGDERGERLAEIWQHLHIEEVFRLTTRDLFRFARRMLGRQRAAQIRSGHLPDRLYGLLDTRPLERLVFESIPWREIRRNLVAGRLDGVCLAATEIATGRTVCFLERRELTTPPWVHDPFVVAKPTRLRPRHALASAAIPLLFPAVRVGTTYYADGSLRLNTPLAPALRLGANRVLVIALRGGPPDEADSVLAEERVQAFGNPLFLFGKVLNALLLDRVDANLAQMELINGILEAGEESFGAEFMPRINAAVERHRGQHFRRVDAVVIRPSADLGLVAGAILHERRMRRRLSPLLRLLTRSLDSGKAALETDLLSYLLFDGEYTGELARLGLQDARAREEELARFFAD